MRVIVARSNSLYHPTETAERRPRKDAGTSLIRLSSWVSAKRFSMSVILSNTNRKTGENWMGNFSLVYLRIDDV